MGSGEITVPPKSAVIPSVEERKKLKDDWLCLLDNPDADAMDFVEGWFKTGKQKARLTEIHLENIKDW